MDGVAEMVKSGVPPTGLTVSVTVVAWDRLPLVPVIVTAKVPVAAVALAVNVRELVDVVGLVPNVAVTPDGRPEAAKVTLPVKPPEGVTVMVLLPLPPWVTDTLEGEAESEKFGVDGGGGNTQLLAAFENSSWIV